MSLSAERLLSSIRKKLQMSGSPHAWLNGLEISVDDGKIRISFRNPLFGKWFMTTWAEEFARLAGREIEFEKPAGFRSVPAFSREKQKSTPLLANFLDNGKNRLALQAAQKAAEPNAGQEYGRLVFCGVPGSGKSHLLRGIHAALAAAFPHRPPVLQRARVFLEQGWQCREFWLGNFWKFHCALLLDDMDELREDYDKQRLLSAGLAQAELDEAIRKSGTRRIIISFGGATHQLARLDKTLYARLQSGLIFEITPPDLTVRMEFLEKTALEAGLELKREQLLFLARQSHHLPVLQGIVKKIAFFKSIANRQPAGLELEKLLEGQSPAAQLGWRAILEKVCAKMSVAPDKALENVRKPEIALARQISMYLCRRRLGISYPELGRLFGGKDHSTVIHAVKKIENLRLTDKLTHNLLTELENDIP